MNLVSCAVWSAVGALACLGAVANAASGVLDMGVVFPRQNETYAPMEKFPFVFVLQNAQLAEHLKPTIMLDVINSSHDIINKRVFDLQWANYTNYTTEHYLLFAFMDFIVEGPLTLRLDGAWRQCDMSDQEEVYSGSNSSRLWVDFNIREGAQTADLITATAEEDECPAQGAAIAVTDETHDVRFTVPGNCSVVDYTSPSPEWIPAGS